MRSPRAPRSEIQYPGGVSSHAVIVHLSEPTWAHPREVERWRSEVFGPVLDALLGGGPAGLVLGGRLAERLGTVDPERLLHLRRAVEEGRVELLTTPLHGACLSAIPREDAKGQLRDHLTAVKRIFGVRPTGCWLPSFTWDPVLPRILQRSGVRWVALDAAWLDQVGAPAADVLILEREGCCVLGLRGVRGEGEGLVLLAPREAADVPAVVQALAKQRVGPTQLLQRTRVRAYLPSGGREGLWESRLLEDDGADGLHKRMLRVSRLVRRLASVVDASSYSDEGPDPIQLRQAQRYLYRAQAGGAYGGEDCSLAVRDRAWRDLLRAETLALQQLRLPVPSCETLDLDFDGSEEVLLRSAAWSVTVAPGRNGVLTEISRLPESVNVVCGMLPLAFRETFDEGRPVADSWQLVTRETPGDGGARAILVADGVLDGEPVQLTKGVQVGDRGPVTLRLEVHHRGRDAARGRLATELFVGLGGRRWADDTACPVMVELGGGKEPLDEVVQLPPVDAVGVAGWRSRIDLDLRPAGSVTLEPLVDGLVRIELAWPVDLFARDRARREVLVSVREVPDG